MVIHGMKKMEIDSYLAKANLSLSVTLFNNDMAIFFIHSLRNSSTVIFAFNLPKGFSWSRTIQCQNL